MMLRGSRTKAAVSSLATATTTTTTTTTKRSASHIFKSGKPFIIYGTAWKKDETSHHVYDAVKNGFRFIDTACQPKHYNEKGVGDGWTLAAKELNLNRTDIFLQTKFTSLSGQDPTNTPYNKYAPLEEQVQQSLKKSLVNLQTSYIDSLILHSPLRTIEDTMRVWTIFESFVDEGTVKRIGLSNTYDYTMFKRIYDQARIKPWAIQNRFYGKSNFDTDIRKFCVSNNIKYQSFWTLTANRKALACPETKKLALRKKLTPQTLMFAFLMSLNNGDGGSGDGYISPLSGTRDLTHQKQDVDIMERIQNGEVIFDDDELRRMAKLLGMPELPSKRIKMWGRSVLL